MLGKWCYCAIASASYPNAGTGWDMENCWELKIILFFSFVVFCVIICRDNDSQPARRNARTFLPLLYTFSVDKIKKYIATFNFLNVILKQEFWMQLKIFRSFRCVTNFCLMQVCRQLKKKVENHWSRRSEKSLR